MLRETGTRYHVKFKQLTALNYTGVTRIVGYSSKPDDAQAAVLANTFLLRWGICRW